MKKKCDCYHTQQKTRYTYNQFTGSPIPHDIEVGVCWGTRETDECSCGGDATKCDFYLEVRKKAKKEQKESNCLIVTYDCCSPDIPTLCVAKKDGDKVKVLNTIQGDAAFGVYEYLKGNADMINKRDIPERVICDGTDESDDVYCPSCKAYIGTNEYVWDDFFHREWKPIYCQECGQSMVWE